MTKLFKPKERKGKVRERERDSNMIDDLVGEKRTPQGSHVDRNEKRLPNEEVSCTTGCKFFFLSRKEKEQNPNNAGNCKRGEKLKKGMRTKTC
jgi:hypothetical protein